MGEEKKQLPKPVDWEDLYPGRFIKATDFKGRNPTLTIVEVEIEELETEQGPKVKGIVSFKETERQWTINRTNGACVKAMFGRKVLDWKGKRVTLFAGEHNGEPAIRVHGSPDIAETFTVQIKLPRKKPFTMTMHKTEVKNASAK